MLGEALELLGSLPYGTLLLGSVLFYTAWSCVCLLQNLRYARSSGLPYTVFPVMAGNRPFLLLVALPWVREAVDKYLPPWLADYVNDSSYSTRWKVKNRLADKMGGIYLTVTPGGLALQVADAQAITEVTMNRERFVKPIWQYESLKEYGTNVVATEKKEWAHHRKHTAPPFNERNNAVVWSESVLQARDMLEHWHSAAGNTSQAARTTVLTAQHDCMRVALHVISGAALGVRMTFSPTRSRERAASGSGGGKLSNLISDDVNPPPGFRFSFVRAFQYINYNLVVHTMWMTLLPRWFPHRWLPSAREHFWAHDDLGNYMRAIISETQQEVKAGVTDGRGNVLGLMIAGQQDEEDAKKEGPNTGLTTEELMGNLHIITFAGHETTARTLHFTMVVLAMNPEIQDWMLQNIDEVLQGESENPTDWAYEAIYPRLIAVLCVMLETLRMYPIVPAIFKNTGAASTTITVRDQAYHLPPMTAVNLNAFSVHYNPAYWGADVDVYDPRRWDASNKHSFLAQHDGMSGLVAPGLEYAAIHKPARGAYLPFSDGVRACLGKKFAQVEFVAVLAVLFRRHRIELTLLDGEAREDAEQRVRKVIAGSFATATLGMPCEVPLTFVRR